MLPRHGPGTSVVVAVKSLDSAKSRMAGLTAPQRAQLALAMATDVMLAVQRTPGVVGLYVVTPDALVARRAQRCGAVPVRDDGSGLNQAFIMAGSVAHARHPHDAVAFLAADVPTLTPYVLEAALAAHMSDPTPAYITDCARRGTTFLIASAGDPAVPYFGPSSARRHRAAGYRLLTPTPALHRLMHDVDTVDDLHAALLLGAGYRTRRTARLLPTARVVGPAAASPCYQR